MGLSKLVKSRKAFHVFHHAVMHNRSWQRASECAHIFTMWLEICSHGDNSRHNRTENDVFEKKCTQFQAAIRKDHTMKADPIVAGVRQMVAIAWGEKLE
jgi:hypothetical protein